MDRMASTSSQQPPANLFSFKLLEYLKEEKLKEDTDHLRRLLDEDYDNVFLVETTGVTSLTMGKVRECLRRDPFAKETQPAPVESAAEGETAAPQSTAASTARGRFAQLWLAGFNRQMDAINALLSSDSATLPDTRRMRLLHLKHFLQNHCPASEPVPVAAPGGEQQAHQGRPVKKGTFGLLLTDCSCVATLQRALSLNNDAPLVDLPLHLPLKEDVVFEGDTGLPAQGDVTSLLTALRIDSSIMKGNITIKHWTIGKKGAVLVDPRVRSLVKALRIKCQSWTPTLVSGVVSLSTIKGDEKSLSPTSSLSHFISDEEVAVLKELSLESVVHGCLVNLFLISAPLDLPSSGSNQEFWNAKAAFEAKERETAAGNASGIVRPSEPAMVTAESEEMNDLFESLF